MTEEPLTVLIVTVDEQYYIPRFLRDILGSNHIDVAGITTTSPTLGTEGLVSFAWQLYRSFGPRVFAQHLRFYGKYRLLDIFNRLFDRGEAYSPRTLAARHDIEYRHVSDVNDPGYVEYASALEPDVLVSIAATQRFETDLLAVPERTALNIHSSLLPEYRGVSPSFWTLRHDEDETGVTVHLMEEEIDTGGVVEQEPIAIRDDDTLHTLNTRVADVGSGVLLRALEQVRMGQLDPSPIDPEAGSYYSLPDRADVSAFLDQGREFF